MLKNKKIKHVIVQALLLVTKKLHAGTVHICCIHCTQTIMLKNKKIKHVIVQALLLVTKKLHAGTVHICCMNLLFYTPKGQ